MILASDTGEVIPRIPVGEWATSAIDWIDETFGDALDVANDTLTSIWQWTVDALQWPPALVVVAIMAVIALLLRSWQFGLAAAVGLCVIIGLDKWDSAMITLAFILIATLIAVVIAVPIGILAARNRAVSVAIRPVLDFMQTMPAFVYLVPTVTLFSIGFMPGLVSTVIFALPPGVRFTELGIRQVDAETVEAGQAFGATPRQILRGIQVPLAMPTIMAGINQVIMLALSMAVLAGIVATPGLGKDVVEAVLQLRVGAAFEAGLAVVILAIYLDRLTGSLEKLNQQEHWLKKLVKRRPGANGPAAGPAPATAEASEPSDGSGDVRGSATSSAPKATGD